MNRQFRDPIHGDIALNRPGDDAILAVIETPEFQRLRRVRQLALASYVYHGAEHSRFTHSLGAFAVMRRVLDVLAAQAPEIVAAGRREAEIAALLHDCGHGPFSHAFEHVLTSQSHEDTTHALITGDTGIRAALAAHGIDPETIVAIQTKRAAHPFFSQLVSSHLDVDRMDYLMRDAYMTGVSYGHIDLDRLISTLVLHEEDGKLVLAVVEKGWYAVEAFLLARYFMHQQVYHHKTVQSVEYLFRAVLRRARELVREGGLEVEDPAFRSVLETNTLSTHHFISAHDVELFAHLERWRGHADSVLADLARRILDRDLLKAYAADGPLSTDTRAAFRRIVADAGHDPDYYAVEFEFGFTPLPSAHHPLEPIRILGPDGVKPVTEYSEVLRGLEGRRFPNLYLLFPKEVRTGVEALMDEARG